MKTVYGNPRLRVNNMTTTLVEPNKLLALGESLRENPKTILLSIPVLGFGILWFGMIGNKYAQAGAFGHLGLAFRLYYKHHWQNKIFLRIAHKLLENAQSGEGSPTVIMVMGGISAELGDKTQAKRDYEQAIKIALKIGDVPQAAFIESHLGKLLLDKKHLDHAYKVLSKFAQNKREQRPHIWLSNVELGYSEWYLAKLNKKMALYWANKTLTRANKYKLETRKLDVANLLKKIWTE